MSIDRRQVLESAQRFAAAGQIDNAIVEYKRLLQQDPGDARVLVKIADLLRQRGDHDDAVATYVQVAEAYTSQRDHMKAVAVYKQILAIAPDQVDVHGAVADLYIALGLPDEALAHLTEQARALARAGHDEELVVVYQRIVEIEPSSIPARIKFAELLSKLKKAERAASEFEVGCRLLKEAGRLEDWARVAERLLFHRPNDARMSRDLAKFYLERKDAKRALPKLQTAFKGNPRDVDVLAMLAAAFRDLGQLPKTVSVLKELARLHQDAGRNDKRIEVYRQVLEIAPTDSEAREALKGLPAPQKAAPPAPAPAPVSAAADEPEEIIVEDDAVDEEIVVTDEPDRSTARSTQSAASRPAMGAPAPAPAAKSPDAKQAAVAAVLRPDDPTTEVARILGEADIFVKYGLRQKAIAHLQRAVEILPTSVDAHSRLRDLYSQIGDHATSLHHVVQIAIALSATDPESALAELDQVFAIDPQHAEALELRARLTSKQASARAAPAASFEAETADEPATLYEGPVQDIEEGLDEAEFFITQGLFDDARETLQNLQRTFPNHPLVMEKLAEINAQVRAQQDGQSEAPLADKVAEAVHNVEQGSMSMLSAGAEMLDVESVFTRLPKEVAAGMADDETHFNLGVAYKDLGSFDDAINEFKMAARAPRRAFAAYAMMGQCALEKGNVASAIDAFKRALSAPHRVPNDELGVLFDLGAAYERAGDHAQALATYRKLEQRAPGFRNVNERVQRLSAPVRSTTTSVGQLTRAATTSASNTASSSHLRPVGGARPSTAPSVADKDEVDKAFDDLLKG